MRVLRRKRAPGCRGVQPPREYRRKTAGHQSPYERAHDDVEPGMHADGSDGMTAQTTDHAGPSESKRYAEQEDEAERRQDDAPVGRHERRSVAGQRPELLFTW